MRLNVVPPRTGLAWVRQGIRTFLRQPLALAGLFFMLWSLVFVLNVIPFIGLVAALVVLPSASVGFMAASAAAAEGRFPMPSTLFTALRAWRQRRALPVLGGIHAALVLVVFFAASVFVTAAEPSSGPLSPEALMAVVLSAPMLVAVGLQLLLNLLFAHASALALWQGVPAAKAIFFTVVAVWRNLPAFAVYFVGWAAVLVGLATLLATLLRAIGLAQPAFFAPFALLLTAMASTSLWFTFRDCYEPDAPPTPSPDGEAP